MALDKQIHIYGVDTGNFYSHRERALHWKNASARRERNYIRKQIAEIEQMMELVGYSPGDMAKLKAGKINEAALLPGTSDLLREYNRLTKLYKYKGLLAKKTKEKLLTLLANKVAQNEKTGGRDHVRQLDPSTVSDKNVISIFDSSLSRTIGIGKDEFTDALMVVQIYYFDVFKDMCYFGYEYAGEKYRYFTSSAGQIRKKKAVFIKESIWNRYEKTLMCGLTLATINKKGGNNVN